jgi:hypothetical protein
LILRGCGVDVGLSCRSMDAFSCRARIINLWLIAPMTAALWGAQL